MNNTTAEQMHGEGMFAGVQDYYARYRPPITPEVVDAVLRLCPANVIHGDMVDLGTGTGQVVRAFSSHFKTIYAVELDPEMLSRARTDWDAAKLGSTANVLWELSDVADFVVPSNASVSLVTTCRSFHWMDQAAILKRYAAQTLSQASFAVFGDSSFWESSEAWAVAVRTCVQSFLGEERRARSGTFVHHRRPYADIVKESPFSNVSEAVVPVDRTWSATQVIGYLYSTTFASRDLFADRIGEFELAIHEVLSPYKDQQGLLYERASFKIVVGTKP